jgi:hypothetical protein
MQPCVFPSACGALAALAALVLCAPVAAQVQTTVDDFFIPGTQPGEFNAALEPPGSCTGCHSDYNPETEPYHRWVASMMGQAGRDPIFFAALAVAEQDSENVGELCLRCHAPLGWLNGRSVPTDGSALTHDDGFGVACIVCHRMVNPVFVPGESPAVDQQILASLANPVVNPHNSSLVIDPEDRRRGPYNLGDFFIHAWEESPYHRTSAMCANCHEVSNPAFTLQPDGTYALNTLGAPPPSDDKYTMFPVERTYSEWLMSDFALGPIDMGGRFGGTLHEVSTCQDCHMPQTTGMGCVFGEGRNDLKQHDFNGANTWVMRAIHALNDPNFTTLTFDRVEQSIARAKSMLERAADLELSIDEGVLTVRVVNQVGHKLPTGYVEGRRMWVNVRFYDASDQLVEEAGAYDFATAELDESTTKVYEAKLGTTPDVADSAGVQSGIGFHFAVNNKWFKDNRIPPRGFTNANFESVQAEPIGYSYADGQHWDDTPYTVPPGAVRAEVRLYHQTTTKEYIEFLRDQNVTNNAGQVAYDAWADPLIGNKSEPVEMEMGEIMVPVLCAADFNGDGQVDGADFGVFGAAFGSSTGDANFNAAADFNADGQIDGADFGSFGAEFGRTDCAG